MSIDKANDTQAIDTQLSMVTEKLLETETALRVMLECRARDMAQVREEFAAKIKNMVVPYLENLKRTQLSQEQADFIDLLDKNLQNFYDIDYAKLSSPVFRLSPTEIKVAQLIRDGKTNKEIARLMHLSKSTILTHRHHIRVKLGLKNKKINLRSFLLN